MFTPAGKLSIPDKSMGLHLTPAGNDPETFTMTVLSNKDNDLLYYVEITFSNGYVPAPGEISVAGGESCWKYPGTSDNRYIWNLKKDDAFQQEHTITFNIDHEVRITKIMVKSVNSFQVVNP